MAQSHNESLVEIFEGPDSGVGRMDLVALTSGGAELGGVLGTVSLTHFAGKETEEPRRTKTISSFPGPWTLPGCLEATTGPEPTAKPVSSAGCTTGGGWGGSEGGARRSAVGNETSNCCLT